jgi:glutamyl-tRNA reductase
MEPGTDRVGVVGLGAMGRPMTEHLLRRTETTVAIHGRGRDRYADLVDAGALRQHGYTNYSRITPATNLPSCRQLAIAEVRHSTACRRTEPGGM